MDPRMKELRDRIAAGLSLAPAGRECLCGGLPTPHRLARNLLRVAADTAAARAALIVPGVHVSDDVLSALRGASITLVEMAEQLVGMAPATEAAKTPEGRG